MTKIKLNLTIDLFEIINLWCEQTGYKNEKTNADKHKLKYLSALEELHKLVLNHHKELTDGHFSRIMRFLTQLPIEIDEILNNEAIERWDKLKYKEV